MILRKLLELRPNCRIVDPIGDDAIGLCGFGVQLANCNEHVSIGGVVVWRIALLLFFGFQPVRFRRFQV